MRHKTFFKTPPNCLNVNWIKKKIPNSMYALNSRKMNNFTGETQLCCVAVFSKVIRYSHQGSSRVKALWKINWLGQKKERGEQRDSNEWAIVKEMEKHLYGLLWHWSRKMETYFSLDSWSRSYPSEWSCLWCCSVLRWTAGVSQRLVVSCQRLDWTKRR